jgi:virulence factor
MRIALVGLGDIAQKAYLPLVARRHDITPVLCTRNAELLQQLSACYRIPEVYSDYQALLDAKPDAVMIHSSTDSHYAMASAALERGIAVFVDKPFSYHLAEAEALIARAQALNVPLFCGFNRRYAPLYQAPLEVLPVTVHYQKNRYNLPGDPRTFIYDDFIHVLDFVRHAAAVTELTDINLSPCMYRQKGQLGSAQVSFEVDGRYFCALMNRLSGQARERLEYSALNETWQVDNIATGIHYRDNNAQPLGFSDWDDTLYKRGFMGMLDAFVAMLRRGQADPAYLQGVLASHRLCERLVQAC